MGNKQSVDGDKQTYKHLYYGQIESSQHGIINIYKHQDIYLQQIVHVVQSQNSLQSQLAIYKIFLRQEKHFQKIYTVISNKQHTCRKDFQIHTLSNYYSFTLKNLIERKIYLKSNFTEPEIWYILRSITEAGAYLQKKNLILGDIRPQTIFISHQHNIRVPVVGLLPNYANSNFYKSFLGFKQGCFFSPEQLYHLKKNIQIPQYNHFKSQVFSLGITLLECITKAPSSSTYYQYNNFCINQKKLRKTLGQLQQICSQNIVEALRKILNLQQQHRPDFKSLKIWLELKNNEIQDAFSLNIQQKESNNTTITQINEQSKEKKKISLKR